MLSGEDARSLACSIANEQAREHYGCEPFGDDRPAAMIEGRWVWSDRRAQGHADIEAMVRFARDGSVERVDVLLLDSSNGHFK
jgi:hypothetical protein